MNATHRLATVLAFNTAAALAAFFPLTSHAAEASCEAPGPTSDRGRQLAQIAEHEYKHFNGHQIDDHGRLWKFGSVETENEPLLDVATGKPDPQDPERFAWRRVWHYWQTLDQHVPGTVVSRRIRWTPGLLAETDPDSRSRYTEIGKAYEQLQQLPDGEMKELMAEALTRAAINDVPWSAAFTSFVMSEAKLPESAFHYSSAHAVYIRPALEGDPNYAFRACDPRHTVPRVGDLICYSRGSEPLLDFNDWKAHASELSSHTPSHCDVVVSIDQAAAKMESIGGNVEQAVTLRKMMLKANGTLSDRHQVTLHPIKPGSECGKDLSCSKNDLNLQYWGVLLQLR